MHIGKRLLPVWPSKNYQTDRASLHVPEEYFPNPLRAIGVLAMTPSGRPMLSAVHSDRPARGHTLSYKYPDAVHTK